MSFGFTYNPASQIASRTSSNNAYSWTGYATGTAGYTAAAGAAPSYDARGNLTSAGGQSYGYDSRNQLNTTSAGGLWYRGPTGMLSQESQVGNLDWVGTRLATLQWTGVIRRFVYAPGEDTPLVWYEGAGTADRRWLHADERGSVIAVSDGSGVVLAVNQYDRRKTPAPSPPPRPAD